MIKKGCPWTCFSNIKTRHWLTHRIFMSSYIQLVCHLYGFDCKRWKYVTNFIGKRPSKQLPVCVQVIWCVCVFLIITHVNVFLSKQYVTPSLLNEQIFLMIVFLKLWMTVRSCFWIIAWIKMMRHFCASRQWLEEGERKRKVGEDR